MELVALYRAGYIYNAAMVRCMPATNFSTCLSLGVQRPLAQFVTKIESPRMALLGLVSGGSPQTIGISRTTPGPTQCTCHSVYIYDIYTYMQAYAMVRHLSRKYNRPGHASHTLQLIMVKILWITKRMSSPRSASQNTSSSSSSSTMVGVEPLAAADRSHARRE